jgi:hypothetical protein
MEKKLLFYVEFGEPRLRGLSFTFGGSQAPVFVVAKDYNEAAEKALAYVEYKNSDDGNKRSILTADGSLDNSVLDKEDIKIKSISIASEDIVW